MHRETLTSSSLSQMGQCLCQRDQPCFLYVVIGLIFLHRTLDLTRKRKSRSSAAFTCRVQVFVVLPRFFLRARRPTPAGGHPTV